MEKAAPFHCELFIFWRFSMKQLQVAVCIRKLDHIELSFFSILCEGKV